MANVNVLNQNGEVVRNVELNDSVWAIEPNQQAMFDAVMVYRNSTRQATAKTKTRSGEAEAQYSAIQEIKIIKLR